MTHGKDVVRTKETRCLNCGAKLDALGTGDTSVEAKPNPGDTAVCIRCGAVMILDDQLLLRGMTDEEMDRIMLDHEFLNQIASMVGRIKFMHAAKG